MSLESTSFISSSIKFFCGLYWMEISLLLVLVIGTFLLDQKFQIDLPKKLFLAINHIILQRFLSLLAFYIPFLEMVNTHMPLIGVAHPYMTRLFLPHFITDSIELLQRVPFLSFTYLIVGYGIFIRYKIPKDRLTRFNFMYSIILMSFLGTTGELFDALTDRLMSDPINKSELALLVFILWLSIFIPCFFRAFFGRYESNAFMREAIEIHLGRDGPDFIWWDRTRKDQAPKPKPKPERKPRWWQRKKKNIVSKKKPRKKPRKKPKL
uniref:hypothetical protein n=1 Tax=Ascoseira mirabilis TaxID=76830 RepID=UPI00300136FD|nr:hypothetical protein ASMI072 [Ascoseira mirabilis]